jgi:glucose-6-phosphate dehydrogenase assembly protein OpcA
VPQIILGLTVPDLPIVLWSRDPGFINSSNVDGLLGMADKVIVDSTRIPDPEQGLRYVKNLLAAGINVGDLAWTRMSPWRQSVAQIFEDAGRPALQKVRITYYKQSPSVSGRYLAAWFRQVVPGITVSLERAQDLKRRSIFLEAAGLHASVEVEGSTAYSTVNGLTRESAVPDRNDATLLREELAILGQDATFRKLIQSAQ